MRTLVLTVVQQVLLSAESSPREVGTGAGEGDGTSKKTGKVMKKSPSN